MAEDVEILSSESTTSHTEEGVDMLQQPSISDRNGVSSTESDCIIDVVSTGDVQPVNVVSSISDLPLALTLDQTGNDSPEKSSRRLACELGSPTSSRPLRSSPCSTTSNVDANPDQVSASCEIVVVDQVSKCNSDCDDCDIIVDDGPAQCSSGKEVVSRKRSKSGMCAAAQIVRPFTETPTVVCLSQSNRLSRSTTPSPSVSRFAPSSPGTPRQRSGSLNGTMTTPSPRPSARGTPGERPRAGSEGELELKERHGEEKPGVRILNNLDILQLPRPRNPGGLLPHNGGPAHAVENEALDLIMTPRSAHTARSDGRTRPEAPISTSGLSLASFLPGPGISTTAGVAMPVSSSSSSYLISNIMQTTPRKLGASKPLVNHVSSLQPGASFPPHGPVRGGWTSTINESVERPQPSSVVDSEGVAKKIARLDDSNLLPTSVESLWSGRLNSTPGSFRGVRGDRTPPERPKPPRRGISPLLDSVDVSGDRFISPSRRRRISPVVPPGTNSGRSTPQSFGKALKCTLCDYTTHEKVLYRRHRRLHHRGAGAVVLYRCAKCSYSTSLARRLKEHYQQLHPHEAAPNTSPAAPDTHSFLPAQRGFLAARNFTSDTVSSFPPGGTYYDNTNMDPLLIGRNERLGYPFINPANRQSSLNYPLDQYSVPQFGEVRSRQEDQLASNYLRSIVTSIINSESSSSRQPPSSTVTSSSFFLPGAGGQDDMAGTPGCYAGAQDTCRHPGCGATPTEVKVKVEPDTDAVSDISSTANSGNTVTPDISRHPDIPRHTDTHSHMDTNGALQNGNADSSFEIHRPNRHRSLDSSLLQTVAASSNDVPTDLTSPRHGSSRIGGRAMSELTPGQNPDRQTPGAAGSRSQDTPSSTVVKSDKTTRGTQCVLPLIKSELNLDGDYFDYLGRQGLTFRGVDRAVQCNLFSSSPSTASRSHTAGGLGARTQSMSESEQSEHQSSVSGESRCDHCGIAFDDEVIFSIHIGCHSHTDPFKCNVCGKQCANKYAFYSHIMRGHTL